MTYKGGCHCGRIGFEVEGDIEQVVECNCSICGKRGYLLCSPPSPRSPDCARRRQPSARRREARAIIGAYGSRCAITGCDVEQAVEAAHIYPYRGQKTNHASNGVLLRADLHTLFDLHLITVDPATFQVVVAGQLRRTAYVEFHGKNIQLPERESCRPSQGVGRHFRDSRLKPDGRESADLGE